MDVHGEAVRAAAVSYARLGLTVIPCYGVVRGEGIPAGVCTCPKGKDCPSPGKHPIGQAWETTGSNDPEALAKWDCWTSRDGLNVGVVWGERSMAIDVEYDCDAGRQTIEELGLADIETPTFRSSRSVHRIFRWQPGLPEKAVVKVAGLEIRTGGGGRGSQSIAPPSRHASGVDYEWVEGRTPWDVEIAEIPAGILELLAGSAPGPGAGKAKSPKAAAIFAAPAGEGDRHGSLLRLATRKFFDLRDLNDRGAVDRVLEEMRLVNETRCRPPKPDEDVVNVWRSAYQYVMKERSQAAIEEDEIPAKVEAAVASAGRWKSRAEAADSEARAAERIAEKAATEAAKIEDANLRAVAERKTESLARKADKLREKAKNLANRVGEAEDRAAAEAAEAAERDAEKAADRDAIEMAGDAVAVGLEAAGVVFDRKTKEWFPGSWKLEIVKSDPVIYRLVIPRGGREIRIELDVEGIQKPSTVASAILAATGDMLVDLSPGVWPAAWRGVPGKKKTPAKVGLFAKLMIAKAWVEEKKGLENRFGRVADLLRDAILKIYERGGYPADGDEDVPVGIVSIRGGFHRDNHGAVSVAFRWPTVWAAMLAADPGLNESDARKFRRRAEDAGISLGSKVVWVEGRTVRLIVIDRREFELLSAMAVE